MTDPTYTILPNGGTIGKMSKRCMQQITVRGAGSYIEIKQGTDEVLVSEAQLQWVLDAIARAGKYLKWDERSPEPSRVVCGELHPWLLSIACAMPADHVPRGQDHIGKGYSWRVVGGEIKR